jgi:DNA end-binding protein Ku
MAARPVWKGLLQISLVRIPIKVFPATESADALACHQLHAPCHTRIQQRKWCPTCDHAILASEIVKGFEFETGRYVLLLQEELEAVRPPSTRVIDLTQFAPIEALDPIAIDRSYYVAPDGPHAIEPFTVIGAALADTVGIGKLAIYGREYLVAVRPPAPTRLPPVQSPLLLHTLHHDGEIRPMDGVLEDMPEIVATVPSDQLRLAKQLIAAYARPLNLADFTDQYRADLQRLIDAKIAGEEIVVPPPVRETAPAVSLREALEQSLTMMKKKSARATVSQRKRASSGTPRPVRPPRYIQDTRSTHV